MDSLSHCQGGQGTVKITKFNDSVCVSKRFFAKLPSIKCSPLESYNTEKIMMILLGGHASVKLLGFDDDNLELFMEFAREGDLFSQMDLASFTLSDILSITYQLMDQLRMIHNLGYVHRDIKPENVLIISRNPIQVRIADYGLACKMGVKTLTAGTKGYISRSVTFPMHTYDGTEDYHSLSVTMASIIEYSPYCEVLYDIVNILKKGLCLRECIKFIEDWANGKTGDPYVYFSDEKNPDTSRARIIITNYSKYITRSKETGSSKRPYEHICMSSFNENMPKKKSKNNNSFTEKLLTGEQRSVNPTTQSIVIIKNIVDNTLRHLISRNSKHTKAFEACESVLYSCKIPIQCSRLETSIQSLLSCQVFPQYMLDKPIMYIVRGQLRRELVDSFEKIKSI